MRYGVMYHNKKKYSPNVAVAMAKAAFSRADHCAGRRAAEARFNPSEVPTEASIAGLTVYTDQSVPKGYVRICTADDGAIDRFEAVAA